MKGSIKTKLDEKAYERDGYQCIQCGKTTGLEAHHIIGGIEALGNLITLCHGCHKKSHNMAGCFNNGEDDRRDMRNLVKANYTGHPFWGNQWTLKAK